MKITLDASIKEHREIAELFRGYECEEQIINRNNPNDKILTIRDATTWHSINMDEISKVDFNYSIVNRKLTPTKIEFKNSNYLTIYDIDTIEFVLISYYNYHGMNFPTVLKEEFRKVRGRLK